MFNMKMFVCYKIEDERAYFKVRSKIGMVVDLEKRKLKCRFIGFSVSRLMACFRSTTAKSLDLFNVEDERTGCRPETISI